MGYFTILFCIITLQLCTSPTGEVIRGLPSNKQLEQVEHFFAQKLLHMEKNFEEKIYKLNNKVSVLDKTLSQLTAQFKGGAPPGKGFGITSQSLSTRDDCTVEDEKALVGKPVCNYDNCEAWTMWGSCDINSGQQTRHRRCHSKYVAKCPSKTETEIRVCSEPCDFTNCSEWSLWTKCEVSKLGEKGLMLRTRNCWSNRVECNIKNKTETDRKICEPDCKSNQCTEWSDWTKCDLSHIQQNGTKKRARKCGIDSDVCVSKMESQVGICDKNCPDSSVITSYGTCVTLFHKYETWYNAEKVCQQDGGHLISFDNKNKSDEMHTLFPNLWTGFWIDGIQNQTAGDWLFRGGNSTFTSWSSGQPRHGQGHAMCAYVDHQTWQWFSFNCMSLGKFMCEMNTVI